MDLTDKLSPYFMSNVIRKLSPHKYKGVYLSDTNNRFYLIDLVSNNNYDVRNMLIRFLDFYPNITKRIYGRSKQFQDIILNPNFYPEQLINIAINVLWNVDWITISEIRSLNIDFIINNKTYTQEKNNGKVVELDYKWNFRFLSFNPGIKISDIENNPQLPWHWEGIMNNPNMKFDFYLKNSKKIRKYKYQNWKILSKKITISDILDNPKIHKKIRWAISTSSSKIKLEDIINNPQLPWKYNFLSSNPNLTMKFILDNIDANPRFVNLNTKRYSLNWNSLSFNPGIKISDITNNPDLPWNYRMISKNPNMNIKFLLNNFENLDIDSISSNPGITMLDIESNPDLPWNFEYISSNPNLTLEFFNKYNDKDFKDSVFPNSVKYFKIINILQNKFAYK